MGRRAWRDAWSPAISHTGPEGEAARRRLAAIADREQRWSNDLPGIELGYRYQRSPLIADEDGAGPDPDSFMYSPTTWPGARLPHIWLDDGSALHDHLGHCFTLVHDASLAVELDALADAFAQRGAPFDTFAVRSASAARVFEGHRLILVRPDLHVVWRGHEAIADPSQLVALATGARTPIATAR
jgi:hypothetical protein